MTVKVLAMVLASLATVGVVLRALSARHFTRQRPAPVNAVASRYSFGHQAYD